MVHLYLPSFLPSPALHTSSSDVGLGDKNTTKQKVVAGVSVCFGPFAIKSILFGKICAPTGGGIMSSTKEIRGSFKECRIRNVVERPSNLIILWIPHIKS